MKVLSQFDRYKPWHHLYCTSRWRKLRKLILLRDPICVACKRKPSVDVDHTEPHRGVLILFYDATNLRGLCKECHGAKSAGERLTENDTVAPVAVVAGRIVTQDGAGVETGSGEAKPVDYYLALLG